MHVIVLVMEILGLRNLRPTVDATILQLSKFISSCIHIAFTFEIMLELLFMAVLIIEALQTIASRRKEN